MRMIKPVPAVVAAMLICVGPAWADDMAEAEEVKAAMVALDKAFEARDAATIQAMVTSDHTAVTSYYAQRFTTADELATLAEFDAQYSDFSEPEVTILGPGAAMITFENSYTGTFQGRPLPERVFVSEIWRKRDGKWLQSFYQETPIAP